jgi:hypothetical protein
MTLSGGGKQNPIEEMKGLMRELIGPEENEKPHTSAEILLIA